MADDLVLEIVDAMTEIEGIPPTALPPLQGAVDVDAVARLLESSGDDLHVSFPYNGHEISITGGGDLEIDASPGGDAP